MIDMLENSDCAHSLLQHGESNRNFRHAQKHAPHFSAGSVFDIVVPSGNEQEFIEIGKRLGYSGVCFLYRLNDYFSAAPISASEGIKAYKGIIAESSDTGKIKSRLKGEKAFVAIKSNGEDKEIIQDGKADLIFSFESSFKKDFMHHRASGLNHILCRLAKERGIIIGFSLNSLINSNNTGVTIGRLMQNISLCQKFRVNTAIASFAAKPLEMRSPHDMESLFRVLGCKNPEFLKESLMV